MEFGMSRAKHRAGFSLGRDLFSIALVLSHGAALAQEVTAPISAADNAEAKKAAAAQKAAAQKRAAAAFRSRRAQLQRAGTAFDDLFGQGAASQAISANSSGAIAGSGANNLNGTSGNSAATGSANSNSTGTGRAPSNSSSTNTSADASVGSKIVQFAMGLLGKKVGDGSSRALIDAALSAANARTAGQNLTATQNPSGQSNQNANSAHCQSSSNNNVGDVVSLDQAQPGDIVLFENAVFLGMNYWMVMGTPDQWAIVYMVRGNEVILLDQDVGGVKQVQFTTISLADLYDGTINVYHPVANDTSAENSSAQEASFTNASNSTNSSSSTSNQNRQNGTTD
jgi:hypothetical protein